MGRIAAVRTASYEGRKIILSPAYIEAVKALLLAELRLLRKYNKSTIECWYCGSAKITKLESSNHIEFMYGPKEDEQDIKSHGQVFVKLPISPSKLYGG